MDSVFFLNVIERQLKKYNIKGLDAGTTKLSPILCTPIPRAQSDLQLRDLWITSY